MPSAMKPALALSIDPRLCAATVVSAFFLTASFYAALASGRLYTLKEKSWFLSAVSSAVMTLSSFPELRMWFRMGDTNATSRSGDLACSFFIAYLLTDLCVGMVHYRSAINIMTGWLHHIAYTLLLWLVVIPNNYAPVFTLCCILELPTLLLAAGNLDAKLRNDYLFAAVFFATRIVFHIHVGVTFALRALSPPGGPWAPSVVLACALPMHVLWMNDCIRGILRHRRLIAAAAAALTPAPDVPRHTPAVVVAPVPLGMPVLYLVRGLRAVHGRVRAARVRYAQSRPGQAALRLVRRAIHQAQLGTGAEDVPWLRPAAASSFGEDNGSAFRRKGPVPARENALSGAS